MYCILTELWLYIDIFQIFHLFFSTALNQTSECNIKQSTNPKQQTLRVNQRRATSERTEAAASLQIILVHLESFHLTEEAWARMLVEWRQSEVTTDINERAG